jgi:mRNA interferase MazF
MTVIRRGEISWVDLSGGKGSEINTKIRPALIIQNDTGNQYSPTTIIAPITSVSSNQKLYPFEVGVTPQESGLPNQSKILLNQIRTVDKSRLQKKIGTLPVAKMAQVDVAVKISLGI